MEHWQNLRAANSAVTGQEIPTVLQEGEDAAEGQACPGSAHVCCRLPCSWSVECWPARGPRGIALQSFCLCLLCTSASSLPPWVLAECMARTDLTFRTLWGESHPHHRLRGICKGRAHTVWPERALPLVGHQHSAARRKPRRNCSGTLVLSPGCLAHLEEYSSYTCLGKV